MWLDRIYCIGKNVGRSTHIQKMQVAELRTLKWMCGLEMDVWAYKGNQIRNEDVQDKVGVASMVHKEGSKVAMVRTYEKKDV